MKKKLAAQYMLQVLPLFIVLGGYIIFVTSRYWLFPVTSDGLAFCTTSAFPGKSMSVFFRFFNLYLTKIITLPFDNLLQGFAFASFLYHVGIIIFAYLIARKLAGKVQGLLAAVLTTLCPFFFIFTTQYFSDTACLFFGLGALYFSLTGNDQSKIHIKYFLSGFLLIASFFSKPFGIVFTIPVLMNIWPYRSLKKFCFFILGISGSLLFIAICDQIWVGDFLFHLNPENYYIYINLSSPGHADPGRGRPLEITDAWSIAYLIYFCAFLFQGLRFLEHRKKFDWKKRGSFSLALAGLSLVFLLTYTSYSDPALWVHPHYSYNIFIPWIIAFCSIVGFIKDPKPEKSWYTRSNIIPGLLSVLFVIALFITINPHYYTWYEDSFGRFSYLFSLWILVLAITLVLAAGNHLHSKGNGKIAVFIFLLGSFGIMWHNANWANKYSAESSKIESYRKINSFLEKHQELSQKALVVPFDCYHTPKGFEMWALLLLSKPADREKLKYFRETRNFQEILKNLSPPFYLLTKYEVDFLTQEANAVGFRAVPVPDGTHFDLTYYLILKQGEIDNTKSNEIKF